MGFLRLKVNRMASSFFIVVIITHGLFLKRNELGQHHVKETREDLATKYYYLNKEERVGFLKEWSNDKLPNFLTLLVQIRVTVFGVPSKFLMLSNRFCNWYGVESKLGFFK